MEPALPDLAERVLSGDAKAVARALTVVENDRAAAAGLLARLVGRTGRAHRVGITGPPGAGKSTLIAALAKSWRAAGRTVGIVAVDPTSPFSGGALLGDRIRMGALTGDPGVFIRSVATRGALGGLARCAHDAVDVLDAAGFSLVVIETVGVGQSEVAVAGAADTVVVVVAPGSGDAVQAMKGGLFEVADVVVVNQADRPGADALVADIGAGIDLSARTPKPPVVTTVATSGEGVEALARAIDAHGATLAEGDGAARRREARASQRIREEVETRLTEGFWEARGMDLARLAAEVAAGRMAVHDAAGRLLAPYGRPSTP